MSQLKQVELFTGSDGRAGFREEFLPLDAANPQVRINYERTLACLYIEIPAARESNMKYIIAIICLFLITGCSDDAPTSATTAETETSIPGPAKHPVSEKFTMDVEDFFIIDGDRIVVSGQIASGSVATGDTICISSKTSGSIKAEVTGIELFNKLVQQAGAGEHVGIMLGGIDKEQVGKGDRLSSCQ